MTDSPTTCSVEICDSDKECKNTIVSHQTIRVKVLDCRSGNPVVDEPVSEILINDEPLVRLAQGDYIDHSLYPFHKKGNRWYQGENKLTGVKGGLVRASQMALISLGFNPGIPNNKDYGSMGKSAFLRYQIKREEIVLPKNIKEENLPKLLQLDVKLDKTEDFKSELMDNQKFIKGGIDSNGKLIPFVDSNGKPIPFATPTDGELEDIKDEYNDNAYRAAKIHLATLEYYPKGMKEKMKKGGCLDDVDGKWFGTDWPDLFKQWQRDHFNYGPSVNCFSSIKRVKEAKALKEAKRKYITNSEGIVHIPIPLENIRHANGFKLEVRFKNFAVVAESSKLKLKDKKTSTAGVIYRDDTKIDKDKGTGFSVEWVDSQADIPAKFDGRWNKDWGWRLGLKRSLNEEERKAFPQFKTSWVYNIPSFKVTKENSKNLWKSLQEKEKCFSKHFPDANNKEPELVLFALVYCQPVWDGIDDPVVGKYNEQVASKKGVYVWPKSGDYTGRNMHIVSMPTDGEGYDIYGGKGYGLFENPVDWPEAKTRWRGIEETLGLSGHWGIDIFAVLGNAEDDELDFKKSNDIFAVHGGHVKTYKGDHKQAYQYWPAYKKADRKTAYLHLSEIRVQTDKHNVAYVQAGQKIAKSGRTGNIGLKSIYPSHLHFNVHSRTEVANVLRRDIADEFNKMCIPCNEKTPLILPCYCQVTKEYGEGPLNECKFKKTFLASSCWAVNDLVCPFMPKDEEVTVEKLENKDPINNIYRRRVQAQLRKLGDYMPDPESTLEDQKSKNADQEKALDGKFGAYGNDIGIGIVKTGGANVRSTKSSASDANNIVWPGGVRAPDGTRLELEPPYKEDNWYKVRIPEGIVPNPPDKKTAWVYKTRLDPPNAPGPTRQAIRKFRQAILNEYNQGLQPAQQKKMPSAPGCYKLDKLDDDPFDPLVKLNEKAPVISPAD